MRWHKKTERKNEFLKDICHMKDLRYYEVSLVVEYIVFNLNKEEFCWISTEPQSRRLLHTIFTVTGVNQKECNSLCQIAHEKRVVWVVYITLLNKHFTNFFRNSTPSF